jgi:hypothetical protein
VWGGGWGGVGGGVLEDGWKEKILAKIIG